MNNYFDRCLLTNLPLDTGVQIGINNVEYYHMAVGWVIIGRLMARIILNEKDAEPGKTYPDLAGIMRNLSQDEERPIITNDFRKDGYKKYVVPQGFDGRANHLLNYINKTGGIDRTPQQFNSKYDFPISFARDANDFCRMFEQLKIRGHITYDSFEPSSNETVFEEVIISDEGIAKLQEELPKIPMISLVNQKITTGDIEVDLKIETAKELFFSIPLNLEKMRSACETLTHILEPLKKDLFNYFDSKDVNAFFQIVNDFDIRHNKISTKVLEHPEQLEWVFYTLLNSINMYVKLKTKKE